MNTMSDRQREQLKKEVIDYLNAGDLTPASLFSSIYTTIKNIFSELESPIVDPSSWKDLTIQIGKYILQNSASLNLPSIDQMYDSKNEILTIGAVKHLEVPRPTPSKPLDEEEIRAELIKKIKNHIDSLANEVFVKSAEKTPDGSLSGDQIYKRVNPSVVSIFTEDAIGSGVYFRENSLIATNRHVVGDSSEVIVHFHDSKETPGRVIQSFLDVDLAFIRVTEWPDKMNLPVGCDSAAEGETVFAIGSPKGLSSSLTKGTVSSRARLLKKIKFIQHDAAINGGNSGGPLFNARGELIGLNTYNWIDSQGMGFAIPIAVINEKYSERKTQLDNSHNRRYCPLCGHSTDSNGRYCDNCGVDLNRYDKAGENQASFSGFRTKCSCGCDRQNDEKYCSRCGQSFKMQSKER
jgi:hypothetical protein